MCTVAAHPPRERDVHLIASGKTTVGGELDVTRRGVRGFSVHGALQHRRGRIRSATVADGQHHAEAFVDRGGALLDLDSNNLDHGQFEVDHTRWGPFGRNGGREGAPTGGGGDGHRAVFLAVDAVPSEPLHDPGHLA